MRRAFRTHHKARDVCLQLEKSALQGLCSCIYDERLVLTVFDKVEKCLRANLSRRNANVGYAIQILRRGLQIWGGNRSFIRTVRINRETFVAVYRSKIIMSWLVDCFQNTPQNMLLLDAMTNHLGKLDSWPTIILQHLFIDKPCPVRTKKLKRVMAFFTETLYPLN